MRYKTLTLSLLFAAIFSIAHAQVQYIPASIHRLSLSLGGGVTNLFGDLQTKVFKPAARGNFDYNFTPFISAGVEGQYGLLAGGSTAATSKDAGLYSESTYWAVMANVRAGLGQILPTPENKFSELVGGIYLGTGIGYAKGDIKKIINSTFVMNNGTIRYDAGDVIIPINLGINADLPVYRLGINLNFQYNVGTSDALDGYDFHLSSNTDNDAYSFVSLAVRYYFGGTH